MLDKLWLILHTMMENPLKKCKGISINQRGGGTRLYKTKLRFIKSPYINTILSLSI